MAGLDSRVQPVKIPVSSQETFCSKASECFSQPKVSRRVALRELQDNVLLETEDLASVWRRPVNPTPMRLVRLESPSEGAFAPLVGFAGLNRRNFSLILLDLGRPDGVTGEHLSVPVQHLFQLFSNQRKLRTIETL